MSSGTFRQRVQKAWPDGLDPDVIIAIDIGTTGTAVAYAIASRNGNKVDWPEPSSIREWPGPGETIVMADKLPTIVEVNKNNSLINVGFGCDLSHRDHAIIGNFKQMIASGYEKQGEGATHTHTLLQQCCEYFLRYLYYCIEAFFEKIKISWGNSRIEFLFSVTAAWTDPRLITPLRRAAEHAGFGDSDKERVRFCYTDAEAVTICAIRSIDCQVGDLVMVVDSGGATTDISVVKVTRSALNRVEYQELSIAGVAIGDMTIVQEVKQLLNRASLKPELTKSAAMSRRGAATSTATGSYLSKLQYSVPENISTRTDEQTHHSMLKVSGDSDRIMVSRAAQVKHSFDQSVHEIFQMIRNEAMRHKDHFRPQNLRKLPKRSLETPRLHFKSGKIINWLVLCGGFGASPAFVEQVSKQDWFDRHIVISDSRCSVAIGTILKHTLDVRSDVAMWARETSLIQYGLVSPSTNKHQRQATVGGESFNGTAIKWLTEDWLSAKNHGEGKSTNLCMIVADSAEYENVAIVATNLSPPEDASSSDLKEVCILRVTPYRFSSNISGIERPNVTNYLSTAPNPEKPNVTNYLSTAPNLEKSRHTVRGRSQPPSKESPASRVGTTGSFTFEDLQEFDLSTDDLLEDLQESDLSTDDLLEDQSSSMKVILEISVTSMSLDFRHVSTVTEYGDTSQWGTVVELVWKPPPALERHLTRGILPTTALWTPPELTQRIISDLMCEMSTRLPLSTIALLDLKEFHTSIVHVLKGSLEGSNGCANCLSDDAKRQVYHNLGLLVVWSKGLGLSDVMRQIEHVPGLQRITLKLLHNIAHIIESDLFCEKSHERAELLSLDAYLDAFNTDSDDVSGEGATDLESIGSDEISTSDNPSIGEVEAGVLRMNITTSETLATHEGSHAGSTRVIQPESTYPQQIVTPSEHEEGLEGDSTNLAGRYTSHGRHQRDLHRLGVYIKSLMDLLPTFQHAFETTRRSHLDGSRE